MAWQEAFEAGFHHLTGWRSPQLRDQCAWQVDAETIYSSVGSKSTLLLALNDLIDQEADVAGLTAELLQEPGPPQLIAKGVHLTRQLNESCGDLIQVLLSAESAEPEAAAVVADGMRRHEHGSGAEQPFGRSTSGHTGDRVAAPNGGSARVLRTLAVTQRDVADRCGPTGARYAARE